MDASIEKALNSLGDAVKESLGREGQIISASCCASSWSASIT